MRPLPIEGARPVVAIVSWERGHLLRVGLLESAALSGGILHRRLNITMRPIANKYREGKLKRTLKREFNST
jgi:hypothetical protein